ncbi:MAG: hypothetical protein JXX14_11175 [Deltaproteobacteria bacterium]|nr:hypothetical protein [Deltaproteobacteria bacterium]
MENQVQQLEELLARVRRNRARMAAEGHGSGGLGARWNQGGPEAAMPVQEASMESDVAVDDSDVIDLVHPTSLPPSAYAERDEDDFSSVAPVSVAPAARDFEDRTHEADFSSVAPPPSIAPAPATDDLTAELPPSMAPSSPESNVVEDDFSSVAPVSVAPVAADFDSAERETVSASDDADIPPSMLPVAAIDRAAVSLDNDSADELEIEDSDTVSVHAGSPLETAARVAQKVVQNDAPATPVAPEVRTFQQTAVATANIVSIENTLPQQKNYSVEDVLQRAWRLGKKA